MTTTMTTVPAEPAEPADTPAETRRATGDAGVYARPTHRLRRATALVGLMATAVVIAALTSTQPWYVLGAGGLVLVVGLTLRQPAALPVLAMPTMLLINRAGALSVSDFVLFLGFWPALLFGARPLSRPMRTVLWASAGYQAATLFTVIANPYSANVIEWFHAWLLVAGALLVGWAVGAAGKAGLGLGLYIGASAVIAVVTLVTWATNAAAGEFGPVYLDEPFMMHKNYIGCVLGFAAIIVYTRPRWLHWNDLVCLGLFGLFLAGMLAAQSRQAIIGLALAVAVVALRPDPHHHRSKLVLVAILGGALVVASLVRDQLDSGDQYNSAYQRLIWFRQSLVIWQDYPWFGAGLRWWYTDRFDEKFQPPNAEFEVLSSAGVVGLLAFLLMILVVLVTLWRLDSRFGTLAFVMILMRFVQGQFDLFWVAAQVSIPFAVAGVCLGAHAYATRTGDDGDGPPTRRPRRGTPRVRSRT